VSPLKEEHVIELTNLVYTVESEVAKAYKEYTEQTMGRGRNTCSFEHDRSDDLDWQRDEKDK
jgi:hypothetical protein